MLFKLIAKLCIYGCVSFIVPRFCVWLYVVVVPV